MTARHCGHLAAAALALWPGWASAHAFGARYDLPLPLGFYLAAAGIAVAISFLAALVFLRSGNVGPRAITPRVPPSLARLTALGLRALGLAVFLLLLAAAVWGPDRATDNLATIVIWVLWWVGFLLFSALIVNLWPVIDPFRGMFLGLCRVTGRDPEEGRALPPVLGYLAPLGLLSIAWIELVSDWSESPRAMAVLIVIYSVVALSGAQVFGMAWFRDADPLGRLFDLLGRTAIMALPGAGAVRLRFPGEGLLETAASKRGETALISFLIGMVLFDGLSETPFWAGILEAISSSQILRGGLLALREVGFDLLKLILTLGLFSTVLIFLLIFLALSWLMRACAGGGPSTATYARCFAASLLPIAIAYHLSHYVSYLLIAGQLVLPALSDPLGAGWDLIGTAERRIDVGVIGARQIWWIAMASLVAGHGLSVLVGHRRAIAFLGNVAVAARSQWPMMVAMVGLTVLSLWILSQPIIE